MNPREKARLEEEKKNRKTRRQYVIIGVIVVLLAALVITVNSSLFTRGFAALRVNGTKYTLADVNFEYQEAYMQMANYGILDTSVPLDEQACPFDPEGGTWHDYFKSAAEENLVQKTAFADAAAQAGTALTQEDQEQLESALSNYSLYAAYQGYPSADAYLTAMFGAGNNEKTVRRSMERELLVNRFLTDLSKSFTFTDAEKDAYYEEHTAELNTVNYLYYMAAAEAGDTGMSDEEAMDAARETAGAIAAAGADGEEPFRTAVTEQTDAEAVATSVSESGFLSRFEGDVTAEDLVPGTVFTHETDTGVYAVYVQGLEDNRYNTVSVRHILVKAEDADEDGTYSEEERQAAHDAILAIQDEWEVGERTEESFAALAAEKSEDTGSAETGGLYEDIYKGQMVSEFDAFCFEPHEHGDTAVVWGESTSYAGYHLIYYVGEGGPYRQVLADNALRSDAYNAAVEELLDGYSAQRGLVWRYVMK